MLALVKQILLSALYATTSQWSLARSMPIVTAILRFSKTCVLFMLKHSSYRMSFSGLIGT